MAREGTSPAGQAGFENDISQQEVELLMRGFLESLVEEQKKIREQRQLSEGAGE